MIGIIDYGLGNVRAFANIFGELNVPHVIATQPAQLDSVSRVILPGVGAFDQAMIRLRESGLHERLDDMVLSRKVPVLGVCVGMQILARTSEEGTAHGLGWVDADVVRFRPAADEHMWVPHMGWNTVRARNEQGLFRGLADEARFYFLHSYLVRCRDDRDVLAVTDYGGEFACALGRGNVYGVQFHPEKSHRYGIQLLRNFAEL